MRTESELVQDILEAVDKIEKYSMEGRNRFVTDELVQVWMLHYLQLLGEAVRILSSDFKDRHHEIPWGKIIGMRNILVHSYFGIDLDAVWAVVEKDLPILKSRLQNLAL
jgi:uncharacterized protein with HEPN domain